MNLRKKFLRFRKFFVIPKNFLKNKKMSGFYMHTDISRTAINLYYKNLYYKIYPTILNNHMQKNFTCNNCWKPTRCYVKQISIIHIFYHSRCNYISIKLKNNPALTSLHFRLGFHGLSKFFCHKFVLSSVFYSLVYSALCKYYYGSKIHPQYWRCVHQYPN